MSPLYTWAVTCALLLGLVGTLIVLSRGLQQEQLAAALAAEPDGVAPLLDSHWEGLVRLLAGSFAVLWLVLVLAAVVVSSRLRRNAYAAHRFARYDSLTGLPNRREFSDRARQVLSRPLRARDPIALVVLDLDRFREINDSLGHAYGDSVLKEVARRLADAAPLGSVVARLAGDEFAVLMPVGPDIDLLPDRLASLRREVAEDVEVAGVPVLVEVSLGVALAPLDGDDLDTLLRRADIAVAWAKESGGVARWERERDSTDPRHIALLAELRTALDRDELRLVFQPKVDCRTGRVLSLEALVRWEHPELGLLTPDQFLPLAERTGLIAPLTQRVLDMALRHLREWGDLVPDYDVDVSVNVSARDLGLGLAETVLSATRSSGVSPSRLVLEVTETAMVADPDNAVFVLGRLSASGVRVALDDFGRGNTSLSLLRRLPFSELKIDKMFVLGLLENRHDEAVVTAVLQLGHALGLHVVAEGVEEQAVADRLRELGCDATQGFLHGRPVAAEQVPAVVRAFAAQAETTASRR